MFDDLKNNFDFWIRNKFNFSRKNFIEKNNSLLERNIKENQYTKDILEKYFKKTTKTSVKILDIGSKNWFYAKGEHKFFSEFLDEFYLDGVELDAFRLYSNFYSRFEVAKYHIKDLVNTSYLADNLLNINKKYDYIIWFLPFILKEPHIKWGLPKKFFYPEKLLKHAYELLNVHGQMLIVNQGELEAQVQRELLERLSIKYIELGEIKSDFFQYKHKRYGVLIEK